MGNLKERFKLNLKFMTSSKRLAIISIIGLSISIAMVTQNILFLTSFRNTAFNEFTTTVSDTHIDIQIDNARWDGVHLESTLRSTVTSQLEDADLSEDQLAYQEWVSYRFMYLLLYNEIIADSEFHDTYLVGVDSSYLSLLSSIMYAGTAPAANQFCILTDTETLESTNLNENDSYNLYIQLDDSSNPWDSYSAGLVLAGQTIEFSGIINIDDISYGGLPIPDDLQTVISLALSFGQEIIITNFQNVNLLMQSIFYADDEFNVFGRVVFDLNQFNAFKLDEHLSDLQIYINQLQESILNTVEVYSTDHELDINPYVLPLLSAFRKEFRIFQIFLLLFMLPTLGMSLTLTAYASNQVKKQRDLHIHIYHQRGSSRRMLFMFMLFELVIFSLISTLIGFLIGWPYTLVALKSDSFFSFAVEASIPKPSYLVIGLCLGIGFAIGFFSSIFSLWQKTKTSIDEVLQEHVDKEPFWKRFYIDILFLVLGLIMWIVSSTQIGGGTSTSIEFAFYFAAPAPILIVVGAIMFITRIYPTVVKVTSNLIFKIPRLELSAVSARNAVRRKGSTTRTIILMTLTFALTVSTMIVPDSYQAYDLEDSYYNLGADIVVDNVDILTPEYRESVESIEGVEATSYVGFLELSQTESDLLYTITMMGVDLNNYSNVAFEEPEYTNGRGISDLLKSIDNETDVIGNTNQVELLNLDENNSYIIKNWADEGSDVVLKNYPVEFVDFYEFWPLIYLEKTAPTAKEIPIGLLTNISLLYTIARNDYDVEGKLFVKVKEGYSPAEIATEIETTTQHDTSNIEDQLLISEGTLKATVLFGALNSSMIISLLISSATLIIMMIIQGLEREKEIAILKSFGISGRQLFSFFIAEAIIILVFTMIVGCGLGFGTSAMIMKILRLEAVVPIHEMVFPALKIIWTTFAILGSGLISTIIPIIINTRKKISGALKSI